VSTARSMSSHMITRREGQASRTYWATATTCSRKSCGRPYLLFSMRREQAGHSPICHTWWKSHTLLIHGLLHTFTCGKTDLYMLMTTVIQNSVISQLL
jgi:hypothetical protein